MAFAIYSVAFAQSSSTPSSVNDVPANFIKPAYDADAKLEKQKELDKIKQLQEANTKKKQAVVVEVNSSVSESATKVAATPKLPIEPSNSSIADSPKPSTQKEVQKIQIATVSSIDDKPVVIKEAKKAETKKTAVKTSAKESTDN